MRDALQALLREASDAKRSADFWHAAAGILSGWAGGARLSIRYQGINEVGSVSAGADDRSGRSLTAEGRRSEEHTSELQSRLHLVCRLLLEKKKKTAEEHGARDDTADTAT